MEAVVVLGSDGYEFVATYDLIEEEEDENIINILGVKNAWGNDITITLSINEFNKLNFSLYPNPSKGTWNIKTQNLNMSAIKVYDILGKNVLSSTPNATEAVINGSSLKAGLYFAQIKTAGGVSSIKLVKE